MKCEHASLGVSAAAAGVESRQMRFVPHRILRGLNADRSAPATRSPSRARRCRSTHTRSDKPTPEARAPARPLSLQSAARPKSGAAGAAPSRSHAAGIAELHSALSLFDGQTTCPPRKAARRAAALTSIRRKAQKRRRRRGALHQPRRRDRRVALGALALRTNGATPHPGGPRAARPLLFQRAAKPASVDTIRYPGNSKRQNHRRPRPSARW